jgi:hypothetical protein
MNIQPARKSFVQITVEVDDANKPTVRIHSDVQKQTVFECGMIYGLAALALNDSLQEFIAKCKPENRADLIRGIQQGVSRKPATIDGQTRQNF